MTVLMAGGSFSVGSLVGFVTLFGMTIRNTIMLVSDYQHLVQTEGLPWHLAVATQGAHQTGGRDGHTFMRGWVGGVEDLPG